MNENKIFCSECGAMLDEEDTHTFDGHTMCGDCFNSSTVICENCGDRIWRENAQGGTRLLPKGPPFYHLPCTTLRHFLLIPQPRSGCGFPISSSTTDTSQQPNKTQSPRQTWQKTCIDISRNRQTQGQKPWGKKITAITH